MPVSTGTIYPTVELSDVEATLGYAEESIAEIYFEVEVWTSGKDMPSTWLEPAEYEEIEDVNLISATIELADKVIKIEDEETLKMLYGFIPEDYDYYWKIVEENV
jgi:hypothetical protein